MVVAVLGHRLLQIGDPGLDRLIDGEVEEPGEFPPRLVRPRCAARPPDARGPEHEPDEATEPGDGPKLLGRGHRDIVDVLARMSRRDEMVPDSFDVGVVGRRDGAPAQDQGGRVGGQPHSRGHRRRPATRTTVAITSTATPIDTLIRVAVRRRFLTRRAIGLKPDNCGSSPRPRCNYGAENLLFARRSCTGIAGRDRGIAVAAQESPNRCQQVSRCWQWKTFRSRPWVGGKPGAAGFRGPFRVGRGDDIRRSSGNTSKDIAKYLGVSRATLYRYLAEDAGNPPQPSAAALISI